MGKELEEYKMLVDIYYKELEIFYSKTTIFTTIQLSIFAAVIAGYNILIASPGLFCIGIILMVCLSIIHLLITIRGNTVNEALILTLAEFEVKNGFNLLSDFSRNTKKLNRLGKMNFPSYATIFLCVLFLFAWIIILSIIVYPYVLSLLQTVQIFGLTASIRTAVLCIFSMIYAVTMKVSDLLDEHGLKLFKGSQYVFSIICALFGCLLIIADAVIANVIFAMIIGFVIRKRIDYANHILAFLILSSCFLSCSTFLSQIYYPFLAIILILGFIKDTKYRQSNSKILKLINKMYLYIPIIYALPALIYSMFSAKWDVFFVFFTYDFSYNIARLIGEKVIQRQKSTV